MKPFFNFRRMIPYVEFTLRGIMDSLQLYDIMFNNIIPALKIVINALTTNGNVFQKQNENLITTNLFKHNQVLFDYVRNRNLFPSLNSVKHHYCKCGIVSCSV